MNKIKSILKTNVELREEMLEGAMHLVAPVIAIVEGVHHGSGGKLFYSASELSKYVEAWNGVPVSVNHPVIDDNPASANDPRVLENQVIGRMFNAQYDNAKVRGEIWINMQKAQRIAPEILTIMRAGNPLEVSTGLFSDDDGIPGVWNGEEYEAAISNIRPDHLALLPHSEGACNWSDGCGVRANMEEPMKGNKKNFLKSLESFAGEVLKYGILDNELSHGDIRRKLQTAVDALDSITYVHFLRDVFDDYFIYEVRRNNNEISMGIQETLYKREYSIDDKEEVVLSETITEVKEERTYVPVNNEQQTETDNILNKEHDVQKDAIIKALIACNRNRFTDDDAEFLNTLEVCQLEKFTVSESEDTPEKDDTPEKNETTDETVDTFIDKAPPELKQTLQRAVQRDREIKNKLVKSLADNKQCSFSKEELESKNITELEKLIALGRIESDFSGQSGGPVANANDEVPPMPSVFKKDK